MELKNCAIIYNSEIPSSKDTAFDVQKCLNTKSEILEINELKQGFDIAFAIGGDGTILKAARFFSKTPIFGLNLGRLGFLSQASKEDFSKTLEKIRNDDFRIETRLMLETEGKTALNDFVIKSKDFGRAAKFQLKIEGEIVCDYLADGIIVSTPTGSTAYNLSAGGPVLSPDLDAIIITPICPHTLNARPLVIPANEKISISAPENEFILSVDGQGNYTVKNEISIKKSSTSAKLLILNDSKFYTVLKNKLHWGTPPNYNK